MSTPLEFFGSFDPDNQSAGAEFEIPSLEVIEGGYDDMPEVRGIGEMTLLRKTIFKDSPDSPDRLRETFHIEVDGHKRLVRISYPSSEFIDNPDPVKNKVLIPGFSETERGTARNLHDELAAQHPDQQIITLFTPGVSVYGDKLSVKAGLTKRLDDIANENLRLTSYLTGNEPITLVGTSKGAAVAVHIANQNFYAAIGEELNIQGLELYSPAVVASNVPAEERFRTKEHDHVTRLKRLGGFAAHMAVDIPRNIIKRPCETIDSARNLAGLLPHMIPALAGNILGVARGVEWETIKNVCKEYPVFIVTGSRDPLREVEQIEKLRLLYPHTVHAIVLQDEGHAMLMATKRTVRHMDRLIASVT